MVNFKNWIINWLVKFKKIPFYISITLIITILIFEIYKTDCFDIYLINFILVLLFSFLYFVFLYYLIDQKKFIKIINSKMFLRFYQQNGKAYLKKQIKEVFVEEFLFKYLPFLILGNIISNYFWLSIILTSIVFTYIHKFNNLISLLEFFIFFACCHFFFLEIHFFGILFIPHLTRNLIIEYLTIHKT